MAKAKANAKAAPKTRAKAKKKALVIVESPSKAKTIQKYLGREYIVKASVGHIMDLPKSKLGVDVDNGFEADYQLIPAKNKIVEELKLAAQDVPDLYLATDPDREGEAIAWHISQALKQRGKKMHRVLFNSVTKSAILDAISNPQILDENKYNAQQARRILDRLVGYKISPLLWDKVKRGISAGRVQSVALRLVVEREAEVKAFKPEEYWSLESVFEKDKIQLHTKLFKIDEKDPVLPNKEHIDKLLNSVSKSQYKVAEIEQKERHRKPTPPFITARLQQDASRKLGFSAKKTMTLAQRLYEGKDLGDAGTHGLITYMRTDSLRVEPQALTMVRDYIAFTYGKLAVPTEPCYYKSKKSAQDAHEAIRPTSMEFVPEKIKGFLEYDEFRLYQLIWNRFVASQMMEAIYDQTAVDVETLNSDKQKITFRATGSVIKVPGFMAVYIEANEDGDNDNDRALKMPNIKIGDLIDHYEFIPAQHFTQPPPRFTDASLIKDLEEKGIGRPSTYATILSNLQDREYVEKRENKYYPSELGTVVTVLLVDNFPEVLSAEFTADMESQLDLIEEGKVEFKKILSKFWKPFVKTLEAAKINMKNLKAQEVPTNIPCDKCQKNFVIKWGKLGSFLACSNYPDCKNTQDFKKDDQGVIYVVPKQFTDKKCEKCDKPMVVKEGKFGRFLACSDYPNCKYTAAVTMGIHCPTCKDGELAQKQSKYRRIFYSCNKWPNCNFALWDKPLEKPCPDCKFPLLTEKTTKRIGLHHKCPNKECGYLEVIDPNPQLTAQQANQEPQKTA